MEHTDIRDTSSYCSPSAESGANAEPFDLACFRCGVCCTVYQVRLSRSEAQTIADSMGLDYWDWVGRYCDPRWSDPRSHLIRHDDRGCVFLNRSEGEVSLCDIYRVRPSSCRDWAAGIFKPACQEGLKRFWSIGVDASGRLQGDPEALSRLEEFLSILETAGCSGGWKTSHAI